MSIAVTGYMSNSDIIAWMEGKTDGLYQSMTSAMSDSDSQADCEAALNKIKGDIANCKADGGDAAAIHDEVNAALAQYGDVPGVTDVLQPIADNLNKQYGTSSPVSGPMHVTGSTYSAGLIAAASYSSAPASPAPDPAWGWGSGTPGVTPPATPPAPPPAPPKVTITDDQSTTWSQNIGDTIDDLGKKDQLALINIQEFNSEINQTKQMTSALLDSADKSSQDIISHID